MAGIAFLRRLLMKQAMKKSKNASGIMTLNKNLVKDVDNTVKKWIKSAKKQGQDIDKMGEQEIKYIVELNKPKAPTTLAELMEKVGLNDPKKNKFLQKEGEVIDMTGKKIDTSKPILGGKNVPEVSGIDELLKSDFNKAAGVTDVITNTVTKIKTMEPVAAMKEANSVIGRKGIYKNLTKEQSQKILKDTDDWIFQRDPDDLYDYNKKRPFRDDPDPEDFAHGGRTGTGLNYLLGEDDQNSRMPFGFGGISKARRAFLKLMGGAAAGTAAAKSGLFGLLKGGANKSVVAPAVHHLNQVKAGVDGMPLWFKPLVGKVIKEGDDVTKRFSTMDREIVHQSTLPGSKTPVTVTQDLTSGNVSVDIGMGKHGFADGHLGQPVRLEYRASEVIEPSFTKNKETIGKAGKTKEEFWVEEAEFTGGHPENIKFEETISEKFGKHGSDFSEVEKFATGKVTKASKIGDVGKATPDSSWTPDDFASGGRVPLAEGTTPSDTQLQQYYEEIEKQKKRRRLQEQFYEQRFGGHGPVLEAAQGGLAGMLGE